MDVQPPSHPPLGAPGPTASPPTGAPYAPGAMSPAYHRQLQGIKGAWWRLVVAIVGSVVGLVAAAVAAVFVVTVAARAVGYGDFTFDPNDGINAAEMLATNLGLILLIPVAALLARTLYGIKPRRLSSVRRGLRWTWLGACVAMAASVWVLLFALVLAGVLAEGSARLVSAVVAFLLVVLFTTPLQAAGEEYIFRGLLMQAFGATRLPTWCCCVATGALFATAHLQFQPALFADRLLLGVVFAWLVVRTGGLEASIAIHAIKNVAVLVPAGLLGDVEEAIDPGAVTWVPFVVDVVLLAIVVPWIAHQWRRRMQQSGHTGPAQPPTLP